MTAVVGSGEGEPALLSMLHAIALEAEVRAGVRVDARCMGKGCMSLYLCTYTGRASVNIPGIHASMHCLVPACLILSRCTHVSQAYAPTTCRMPVQLFAR